MADASSNPLPHLRIESFKNDQKLKKKSGGSPNIIPLQNRSVHGGQLQQSFAQIVNDYRESSKPEKKGVFQEGLVIEFKSFENLDLYLTALNNKSFELLNLRYQEHADGIVSFANVFIKEGKLKTFEQKITEYLNQTTKNNKPKNQSLIDSIQSLRRAAIDNLWMEYSPFPETDKAQWWEVWLRAGKTNEERSEIYSLFSNECSVLEIQLSDASIDLPEHTILYIKSTSDQLRDSGDLLNCIAELRKPSELNHFVSDLKPAEQKEFAEDILKRLQISKDCNHAICLLDTGVNYSHPLLKPLISEEDSLAYDPDWGKTDDSKEPHGTSMAGLCAYGDLNEVIGNDLEIIIPYLLESVKIVPPTENKEEAFAALCTERAVYLIESKNGERQRIFYLATSMDGIQFGRPIAWSSILDNLAVGYDSNGAFKRLFCVASGNVKQHDFINYPESNEGFSIENPAQAWNAICVGSYTTKDFITEENQNYSPISERYGMSPTNPTSINWNKEWPQKPDVVFEGGNAGIDASGALELPELSLLTTDSDISNTLFSSCIGTSPATALCSKMAIELRTENPEYWEETIRGLIIHLAEWSKPMLDSIPQALSQKEQYINLVKKVDYGIPSLMRAKECIQQRATLIAQEMIKPYIQNGSDVKMNQYHVYELPWPIENLKTYSDSQVKLKVTLSYFVEPNPGSRNYSSQYRYASCGLRFAMSKPGQTQKDLESSINSLVEADSDDHRGETSDNNNWKLGEKGRSKGSLHQNIWEGSAADLIDKRFLLIYPIGGWWKTRSFLNRGNSKIRYSLILSLAAEEEALDLYTPIATQIENKISVDTISV
tara:strand:- start:3473 stop:5962 length:2490 start_codon:yes stop_codon:yes gene_type:complete